MSARFEIFKDAGGQLRFRLRAPNGETICQSEAYTSLAGCRNGLLAVRAYAVDAEIVDLRDQDPRA